MPLITRFLALAITAAGAATIAYRCHRAGQAEGRETGIRIGHAEGHASGYREGRTAGYIQAERELAKDAQITYLRGVVTGAAGGPLELPLAS